MALNLPVNWHFGQTNLPVKRKWLGYQVVDFFVFLPEVLFIKILFPVAGVEQGHVVSMQVGPSVNPYFEDLTTRLHANSDHTGS